MGRELACSACVEGERVVGRELACSACVSWMGLGVCGRRLGSGWLVRLGALCEIHVLLGSLGALVR